ETAPTHQVREAQTAAPPSAPSADIEVPAAASVKACAANGAADDDWRTIVEALSLGGLVKQLAINCAFKKREDNVIVLQLAQGHSNLLNPKPKQRLQQALGEYYDIDAQLEIEIVTTDASSDDAGTRQAAAAPTLETPAQATQREQQQRQQQAEQAIHADSFVQTLKETFNAEVIPGSIKPVN
ncbi:MAG TPA: hypothetical protein ENJ64_05410, partial [Thiotrichales bacterium]|nr:hypothetical protein [Thiotrichales bacterium]